MEIDLHEKNTPVTGYLLCGIRLSHRWGGICIVDLIPHYLLHILTHQDPSHNCSIVSNHHVLWTFYGHCLNMRENSPYVYFFFPVGPGLLHLYGNFVVLLGNFKFQTRIWPWKSLKPGIQDSKNVFNCEIQQKLWPVKFFKDSFGIPNIRTIKICNVSSLFFKF